MENLSYNEYLNENRIFEAATAAHSNVIEKVLQTVSQGYILHWQALSKGEHETLESFYNEFFECADALIETIQGRYNTKVLISNNMIPVENYFNSLLYVENVVSAFKSFKAVFEKEDDIIAIIDDIVKLGNKTKYLLRLEQN